MGTTVLLVEQECQGGAEDFRTALMVLETGKIVLSGMAEELLHSEGGSEGIPR